MSVRCCPAKCRPSVVRKRVRVRLKKGHSLEWDPFLLLKRGSLAGFLVTGVRPRSRRLTAFFACLLHCQYRRRQEGRAAGRQLGLVTKFVSVRQWMVFSRVSYLSVVEQQVPGQPSAAVVGVTGSTAGTAFTARRLFRRCTVLFSADTFGLMLFSVCLCPRAPCQNNGK